MCKAGLARYGSRLAEPARERHNRLHETAQGNAAGQEDRRGHPPSLSLETLVAANVRQVGGELARQFLPLAQRVMLRPTTYRDMSS